MFFGWLFLLVLLGLLTFASIVDFIHMRIPNNINFCIVVTGMAYAHLIRSETLWKLVVESGLIFVLFWSFAAIYRQLRAQTGLGLGDVKLLAALTPWVGVVNIPVLIFLASISGLLAIAIANVMHWHIIEISEEKFSTRLPFAPFLSLAAGLVLLARSYWGDNLLALGMVHY